jgi:acyl-CoA dehydrogenase
MDFSHSDKVRDLQERITAFMDKYVYPAEPIFHRELEENRRAGNPWQPTKIVEELKAKAKAQNLWNLFLPHSEHGAGLTNLEYAPLCEIMGRSHIAPEAFNCSAPDTGIWKCWRDMPPSPNSSAGSSRCSRARSVPRSR